MRFFVPLLCASITLLSTPSGPLSRVHAEPSLAAPVASPTPEAGSSVVAPGASAPESADQSAPPELNELLARLRALERIDPLDETVRRPVELARAALERSRASRTLGDSESEARTRQLGRAAVELAEARLRLLRERALLHATQTRHSAARAEQATAKQALDHERARALELQREGALP